MMGKLSAKLSLVSLLLMKDSVFIAIKTTMNESEIMETMTFEELIQINCFSEEKEERKESS